jgi:hypothetical protein
MANYKLIELFQDLPIDDAEIPFKHLFVLKTNSRAVAGD